MSYWLVLKSVTFIFIFCLILTCTPIFEMTSNYIYYSIAMKANG